MTEPSPRRFAPRVTVATIVEQDGRFLLVEEQVGGRLVLNQPAGHLDPGESLIEAARRETLEETAYHVEPWSLVGVYQLDQRQRHFVRFSFAARLLSHEPERQLDDGIVRALWLDRDEIAAQTNLRSVMVLRSIDDYLSGQRAPLNLLTHLP
ncbi:MAG: NUDIX hydrolase [Xanthomonadales bacterium]|nr:NUDIX hydrolase [Xanthomonadales bacterium]MCB1628850.1 NUDIX hydrolase [Xanthomonadales bacterium]MCB1635389.1 NUDIX hydrolase [Xanthomonadales bacterium]